MTLRFDDQLFKPSLAPHALHPELVVKEFLAQLHSRPTPHVPYEAPPRGIEELHWGGGNALLPASWQQATIAQQLVEALRKWGALGGSQTSTLQTHDTVWESDMRG